MLGYRVEHGVFGGDDGRHWDVGAEAVGRPRLGCRAAFSLQSVQPKTSRAVCGACPAWHLTSPSGLEDE